jgi:hypothetical protein
MQRRRADVARDAQTWEGVLIYEIVARFESTQERPFHIDPDEQGRKLSAAIEAAIKEVTSQDPVQIGEVRFAGSRGATRYS